MAASEIFVSYRRSDSAGHARLLHRDLCLRFDPERIFFDRASIEAGLAFTPLIQAAVRASAVVLVLIGPGWLDAVAADGTLRLDDEADLVRREVALALASTARIVPVLFDDTPMPGARQLPPELAPLAGLDAFWLRGRTWEYVLQLEKLVELIAAVSGVTPPHEPGVAVARADGSFDVFRGLHYVPVRLQAPFRAAFAPLLADLTRVFGGRKRAVAEALAFAADAAPPPVLVVLAPAGFGKTALLAHLVAATPEAFAFHFFAPVYGPQTLEERFFLKNLVQQMAAWHGQATEPPGDLDALRAQFQALKGQPLPAGRTQVVVLDGLDEVTGWSLTPYLSGTWPTGVRVVASMRDVGQDWRRDLGFGADARVLALDGLDVDGVRDVLAALGGAAAAVAADAALLAALVERAAFEGGGRGADPFYVRFIAEDLAAGTLAPADVAAEPKGLEAWLDRWWHALRALAGDAPVRDMFGTLAAALGPIERDALEAVMPSLRDDWAGDRFDEVLARVRRMVWCDADGGYALAHPRLRRYVADPRRIGAIETYRARLLAHCRGWATHRSRYALRHAVDHLLAAGARDEAQALLSPAWLAAHWQVLRGYREAAAVLERLAKARAAAADGALTAVVVAAVARQTAREIVGDLPPELLLAWVVAAQAPRALDALATQDPGAPMAPRRVARVVQAVLDTNPAPTAVVACARQALRAAQALPHQRSTLGRLEDLVALTGLLPALARAEPTLAADLRGALAQVGDALDDASARAQAQAALGAATGDTVACRRALADAEALAAPADRAAVWVRAAYALPLAEVQAAVANFVALGTPALAHGTTMKTPLLRLLGRWCQRLAPGGDTAVTLALLAKCESLVLGPPVYDRASSVIAQVTKGRAAVGATAAALQALAALHARDAHAAVEAALWSRDAWQAADAALAARWRRRAAAHVDDPSLHYVVNRDGYCTDLMAWQADAGAWGDARALLQTLSPDGRADALLRLAAVDALGRDAEVAPWLAQLPALVPDPQRRAAVLAWLAVQAPGAAVAGRIAAAEAELLSTLPEGDTAVLRALAAAAVFDPAAPAATLAHVARVANDDLALALLAMCLDHTPANAPGAAELIDALMQRLAVAEPGDADRAAAAALRPLHRHWPNAGQALGRSLHQRVAALAPEASAVVVAQVIAADAEHRAPHRAPAQWQALVAWLQQLRDDGALPRAAELRAVVHAMRPLIRLLGDGATAAVAALREALASAADDDAADLAAALALLDLAHGPAAAWQAFAAVTARVAAAEAPDLTPYLRLMISEMAGLPHGPQSEQAQGFVALAREALAVAGDDAAGAVHAVADLARRIDALADGADRAKAQQRLVEALDDAPSAVADAVTAAAGAAWPDDGERRRERAALEPLTPYAAWALRHAGKLAASALHGTRSAQGADEWRQELQRLYAAGDAALPRGRLLDDFAVCAAVVVQADGGPPALDALVDALDDADRAFVDAAALVRAGDGTVSGA